MKILNRPTQRGFMDDDFLLESEFSKLLYHEYAKDQPIIDYHNHLSPTDISQNRVFDNITQIWLAGDHYKWRAMRTLGIPEHFITGNASDEEKFEKWAYTLPYTLRNPLHHWTHLELKRYFGITESLNPDNAKEIYAYTSKIIASPESSSQMLLKKMNVEIVCTTDDPADDLQAHQDFKKSGNTLGMFPAFRPDKSFAVENPEQYVLYLDKLSLASKVKINTYEDLLEALQQRVDYFHLHGGRLADHGLERLYYFEKNTFDIQDLFEKAKDGLPLLDIEIQFFKFKTLLELAKMYHGKGWTQQYHLGALRNTNTRMLQLLGADTGFDSIGDFNQAYPLAKFLNELDKTDQLAKTVLYNLNPKDNEIFATMAGNFSSSTAKGKIQFGSGWWYLDQKDGMERQMNTLSNMGLISCFVGMLTDSRSFLSFPRHEYFRRVLCNLFGKDVENGELPADEKWLGKIISDICYHNAKSYFNFPKE